MSINTTITALPTPPSRNDSPSDFTVKADLFLGALPQLETDLNGYATDFNSTAAVISDNIANVNTVADDLNAASSEIITVSDNLNYVTTVSTNITDVNTVADALNSPLSAASGVSYDNTSSGIAATDVQAAVDSLSAIEKQNIAQVLSGVAQALDLASQAAGKALDSRTVEQLISQLSTVHDLAGQAARAVSGGDVLLRGGTATEPSVSPLGDRDTGVYFPSVDTVAMAVAGLEALRVDPSGRLGIGTDTPSAKLDVEDDRLRLRQSRTPPSATDTGIKGEISWDADYIYICTATNTWKRAALSSW